MTMRVQCPPPERLAAHLAGTLSDRGREEMTAHLDLCAACRVRLAEMIARRAPAVTGSETLAEEPPAVHADLTFLDPPEQTGDLGRLNHYRILGVIGRGGMGVVLKGFDEKLHRVVAIKVMAPHLAAGESARKRFLREGRAQAAVAHDHVVTIHAVEEAKGLPLIVMQFVAGGSLQERIEGGTLSPDEIVRIGAETADGLAAAHAQGLIHRDVKPGNILLEPSGRVKLTDFGLARAGDDLSLSKSGAIVGTPQFMAPEQARGEELDHRADLFSLGSVLYALCTGRPPFRAANPLAVLKSVCDDEPTPIRSVRPETPEWLSAVIARLMAKRPEDRVQTAAEVADLLRRHLPPPARIRRLMSRVPWRPLGIVAAGILLLTLIGAAVWVWKSFTGEGPTGEIQVEVADKAMLVVLDGPGETITLWPGQQGTFRERRPGRYTLRAFWKKELVFTETFSLAAGEMRSVWVPWLGEKRDWGPEQIIGPPDVITPGADDRKAWASLSQDEQPEWVLLDYAEAVRPLRVKVFETFNSGALARVTVFRPDGAEVEAWAGDDPTTPEMKHGVSEVDLKGIDFPVRRVKLYLASEKVPGWNEIDAVGLVDDTGAIQWAKTARASTSYGGGP